MPYHVQLDRDEAREPLAGRNATWFEGDPEHGPVLRLTRLEPWQEHPGI